MSPELIPNSSRAEKKPSTIASIVVGINITAQVDNHVEGNTIRSLQFMHNLDMKVQGLDLLRRPHRQKWIIVEPHAGDPAES